MTLPEGGNAQNLPFPLTAPAAQSVRIGRHLFPFVYFVEHLANVEAKEAASPYWVPAQSEMMQKISSESGVNSILLNTDILAFYGHPLSTRMGILGRYPIEELDAKLSALADEYNAINGERGVQKAFYIIYGTVWPEGEIGVIPEEILQQYIQYALEKDILVIIDHQIGRYSPEDAIGKLLPYLRYPNVHLALDPEWRTLKPMKEIGVVTADEVNEVQRVMSDYIRQQNIQGERLLVIHQFNWRMISERENVKTNYEGVQLVHCADGFGTPSVKRQSYAYNAQARNMPIKGFKLFYNFDIPGAGWDNPLMSPADVVTLSPRPYVIIYQ